MKYCNARSLRKCSAVLVPWSDYPTPDPLWTMRPHGQLEHIYAAPIQDVLQLTWMRSSVAEIVDRLAQHVLTPNRGLFGANDPTDEKYTNKHKQTIDD